MSRLALSHQKRARVHVSRPALALSLAAILLIAAPQIAAAGPPARGTVAGALLISSVSQNEGTGGTTIFTFNLTHTGTSDPFSVTVATDRTFSGSVEATANDDYTGRRHPGSLTSVATVPAIEMVSTDLLRWSSSRKRPWLSTSISTILTRRVPSGMET